MPAWSRVFATLAASAICASVALALTPERPSLEALQKSIVTRNPQTRVERVDHERLAVRRLDVVDEAGVIRMTLAAPTPEPILDGIQYRRAFPVSGIVFYDENGSERGGMGYAQIDGGAMVLAADHRTADAIGWRVMPDGSVQFVINEAPAQVREPALGNRLVPGISSPSRVRLEVAADGAPKIELADRQNRPRIRLAVSDEGYGMIEFLDAEGRVVEAFAPERGTTRRR